jgi:4-alpha-glucanotransferase
MTPRDPTRRRAGVLLPLFAAPSRAGWGIGEIADIGPITEWLAGAGQRVLQLLPINEMAAGQQSPYTAISAMAIDPLYLRMGAIDDWQALGGERSLDAASSDCLAHVRRSARVEYEDIRRLKKAALTASFDRFYDIEWQHDSERAAQLRSFIDAERWWLDDYSLYQAAHSEEEGRPWTAWSEAVRQRDPAALADIRGRCHRMLLYFHYLQWLADIQWREARRAALRNGIELFGDLPFMVSGDSADVWRHQQSFHLDISVGAPPDAFSDTGQDWGMPLYNWDACQANDFLWLRERARRNAALYDGFRVDHLVGFYRTYARPGGGRASYFTPAEESDQQSLGERILTIFRTCGAEIIAEDLGAVPDFVRASLAALGIPGFRVFRWERQWKVEGQPFLDPIDFPAISVATSGTHDTDALVVWWSAAASDERNQICRIPSLRGLTGGIDLAAVPAPDAVDYLLEMLNAAGSDLVLVPITDVFGWPDRINEPGTVNDRNWTFRLPWPIDELDASPEAQSRRARLRLWADRYHRR